jgi:hypothetical protein
MTRIDPVTQNITNEKCSCHRSSVLKGLKTQQGTHRVICWLWVNCPAKPAKCECEPNKNMFDTLSSLRIAALIRRPDSV